jgi:hypothetical protein
MANGVSMAERLSEGMRVLLEGMTAELVKQALGGKWNARDVVAHVVVSEVDGGTGGAEWRD